ncbi:MAG: hypothetical protein HOH13_05505 [Crocinitomicaceae bacterium]|nr:hypothetical protein [Crocinitomicaceae bacterium]
MIFTRNLNLSIVIHRLIFAGLIILIPLGSAGQYGGKKNMYTGYTAINEGLEKSRSILGQSIDKIYYDLTLKYQTEGDVFLSKFNLGMNIRDTTQKLITYINELKVLLIAKCEDLKRYEIEAQDTIISLKYLKNYDDCITPSEIIYGTLNSKPKAGPFSAVELVQKLNHFQQTVDSVFVDNTTTNSLDNHLGYTTRHQWKSGGFKNKPLAAVITLLSKLQLDIKLQEVSIINHLINATE